MAADLEALAAHRRAVAATIPLLEAIRSIAELAFRQGQRAMPPLDTYAGLVDAQLGNLVAALDRDEQATLLRNVTGDGPPALLLIASERGLCGAFNEQLVARALQAGEDEATRGADLYCWGTRGSRLLARAGRVVRHGASLPSLTLPPYLQVETLALDLLEQTGRRRSRSLTVIHSAPGRGFQYGVTSRQLLPPRLPASAAPRRPVAVKPTRDTPALLTHLLTETVLMGLYRAVVASALSEQLARIAAMGLATERARQLLRDLTDEFNSARQQAETQALLEIVTGYRAAATSGQG